MLFAIFALTSAILLRDRRAFAEQEKTLEALFSILPLEKSAQYIPTLSKKNHYITFIHRKRFLAYRQQDVIYDA